MDRKAITKLINNSLPHSNVFTIIINLNLNLPCKFILAKHSNNNYYLFIKRIANYYKEKDSEKINKDYNLWGKESELNTIKSTISNIKQIYGNDINLKICHMCVPIKKNEDCVYYFKELKDINFYKGRGKNKKKYDLTIDFIENTDISSFSNIHNGDFSTFEVYGSYSWEYINNL